MIRVAAQPGVEPYATVGLGRLWCGDAREPLPLPDGSVHCVVTSPPYWGLRDYGTATWEGGDAECDHAAPAWADDPGDLPRTAADAVRSANAAKHARRSGGVCRDCGARRVDRQLGSEATPEEYVAKMVEVFRDVRRVLRDDGVLWLNLGDSYASKPQGPALGSSRLQGGLAPHAQSRLAHASRKPHGPPAGMKHKDLCGIPWMVAFALRADGWYLRSDCIWSKPNPMPESVTDRPTKAHEYVFLLTKSERYHYDAAAVREPDVGADHRRNVLHQPEPSGGLLPPHRGIRKAEGRNGSGRNLRSVWPIATRPYSGAHFAVFPPELARTCILAGTSARGCCAACAAPWRRVVERGMPDASRPQGARAVALFRQHGLTDAHLAAIRAVGTQDAGKALETQAGAGRNGAETQRLADEAKAALGGYFREFLFGGSSTIGWEPTCACAAGDPVPCTVLDPFTGSGTSGEVALQLGRAFVGRDLNRAYLDDLAIPRLRDAVGHLFADTPEPPRVAAAAPADPSLFGEVAP
jgi:DNA modification methylase